MAAYFGTPAQRELQARTWEKRDWVASTPGLYNAGRFIGTENPDVVPWETLEEMLRRDGILGLRMISPEQAGRLYPRFEQLGCRVDRWDVFVGAAAEVVGASAAILERGLPQGLDIAPALAGAESDDTTRLQQFCADNGLAPFPGAMLAEGPPHAATIVIAGGDGRPVAAGHSYFPHNSFSPFSRHAWVGLVSVSPAARGKGLGLLVNGLLVRAAIEQLGATHVYELVASDNVPSRRMVEACGLTLRPELVCGVAVPTDAARFTR